MTLKALLHLANLKGHSSANDRYHGPPWSSSGSSWSSGWKSKGGGSGAAISALALLAFLFFLNTMQQTMMDNTMMDAMGNMEPPAILLRSNNKNYNREPIKKPIKEYGIENDNTFWNTQRLQIDGSGAKNTENEK